MASRKDVAELIAGRTVQVFVTAANAQGLSRQLLSIHSDQAEAIATTLGALIIMIARSGPDAVDVLEEVMLGLADARGPLESRRAATVSPPAVLA